MSRLTPLTKTSKIGFGNKMFYSFFLGNIMHLFIVLKAFMSRSSACFDLPALLMSVDVGLHPPSNSWIHFHI